MFLSFERSNNRTHWFQSGFFLHIYCQIHFGLEKGAIFFDLGRKTPEYISDRGGATGKIPISRQARPPLAERACAVRETQKTRFDG